MTPADSTPTPDPTILTTEQILREVENAIKLLRAEIKGLEKVIQERFQSVNTQFELIERQRVEQKTDTAVAVQAALSAAKEAVKEQTTAFSLATDKSERAFTEQLKQLTATFDTAIKGLTDLLGDMKERVGRIESVKQGGQAVRDNTVAYVVAGVAVLAFIASVAWPS